MKTAFGLFFCFLFSNGTVHAQMWLTQDAVWHYDFGNNSDGYRVCEYTGDTLLGGREAQKVVGSSIHYNPLADEWETMTDTTCTNLQDSIVYLWVNQGGTWAWDTLYLFNGVPGDRWWPIYGENICPAPWGMLEVQDTTTTIIDGIPLRTWCVAYLDEAGEPEDPGCFEVYERIGSERGLILLPGGCLANENSQRLRCYGDEDIPLYETGVAPSCAYTVGVDEPNDPAIFSVFPNPGTDHLHVITNGNGGQLYLFDATGRIMRNTSITGTQTLIDVASLSAGPYCYRMVNPSGMLMITGLWVKE